MERVEEIGVESIAAEESLAPEQETAVARSGRSLPRWLLPSIAFHIALAGVIVVAALRVNTSMELLASRSRAATEQIENLSKRTTAHVEETQALKHEVGDLKQFLVSHSSEDVIFLKIEILKPEIDPELARVIAKNVHHYSELYGRDANLVLAIIAVESRFDPKAISPMGALGLMQVMPQWKKVLGITGDLHDPETSIKYGLQILGFYTEMYKDMEMSLTAYNRGPGQVDSALMRGQDPKNKYAPRVLETYNRLSRLTVSSGQAEQASR